MTDKTEKGWYLMHRGWQKNGMFKDEPFTEREAFEWMISEATYETKTIAFKGNPVKLTRGQLSHSIRHMADEWGWSKSKIESYLNKLKKWDAIRTDNRTGQNIITICNYDEYQNMKDDDRTQTRREIGQPSDNHRTINNEDNQDNKVKIKDIPSEYPKKSKTRVAEKPADVSDEIWADYKTLRQAKRAPVTETVIAQNRREAEKAGWTLESALSECCARGWQGFKADWVNKNNGENYGTYQPKLSKSDRIAAALDAAQEQIFAAIEGGTAPENLAIAPPAQPVIPDFQPVRQGAGATDGDFPRLFHDPEG